MVLNIYSIISWLKWYYIIYIFMHAAIETALKNERLDP